MYKHSYEYSKSSKVFQKLMVKNNNNKNSKMVIKLNIPNYIPKVTDNSNAVVYFFGSTFNTGGPIPNVQTFIRVF